MAAEAEAPSGQGAELAAQIGITLGHIGDRLARIDRHQTFGWEDVHPVPIGPQNLTASGTVDFPDQLGPRDGYWWDVRRISIWGFTAGTVAVYLNDPNGEQVGAATSAGQLTWGTSLLLGPRDRLIFVASNITGNVRIGGQAFEVKDTALPRYLI